MFTLSPAEIRAIGDDLGGASETARRLGVERRTVSRWRAGDTAPANPGDLIDAWCVAQIERAVADMAGAATHGRPLKGRTVRLRGTIPAGVSDATARAMESRLRELARIVFEGVTIV